MTAIQPLDLILLSILCLLGPRGRGNLQSLCGAESQAPINEALARLQEAGWVRYCYHTYAAWPTVAGRQLFKNRATALTIVDPCLR